jgi:hypothetical protein
MRRYPEGLIVVPVALLALAVLFPALCEARRLGWRGGLVPILTVGLALVAILVLTLGIAYVVGLARRAGRH